MKNKGIVFTAILFLFLGVLVGRPSTQAEDNSDEIEELQGRLTACQTVINTSSNVLEITAENMQIMNQTNFDILNQDIEAIEAATEKIAENNLKIELARTDIEPVAQRCWNN